MSRYSFVEYDYNRLTSAFETIYARNFFRNQNVVVSGHPHFLSLPAVPGLLRLDPAWRACRRPPSPPHPAGPGAEGFPWPSPPAAKELRVNVTGYYNLFSGGGLGSETETFDYPRPVHLDEGDATPCNSAWTWSGT